MTLGLATIFLLAFARMIVCREPKPQPYRVSRTQFVRDFDAIDAPWPDDWARWQRALIDAANDHTRKTGVFVNAPRLEDLR